MRRRNRMTIEPKFVLASLSVLCIALMILSFRFPEKFTPLRSLVGEAVTPMQKGINMVGTWLYDKTQIFASMKQLVADNKDLKEQVDSLTYENKILKQEKYELDDLRELYKLDAEYASYPKVAARVISADSNNWFNQFCIDKGTDDGIAVNMNVIAGGGLVGIVTKTGENWAMVRTIIDDKTYVTSMTLKNSDRCTVKGNLQLIDQGLIEFEMMDVEAELSEGDEIVTSHTSYKYLPGILVGYVSKIQNDSSNMTKSGYITPAVSFDSLNTVLVITELNKELPKDAIDY